MPEPAVRFSVHAGASFLLLTIAAPALAPAPAPQQAESIPMTAAAWTADGATLEFAPHLGRDAMRVSAGEAIATGVALRDGMIEFDVVVAAERGFAGVNFRRLDANEHERFYLRAHQSGNPDANQYTPVFRGTAGWQIYYGPQYASPTKYRHGEWMRVRLILRGDEAEVHLDGKPILHIAELERDATTGGISLWTNISPAWFANVSVTVTPAPFALAAIPNPELPAGTIRTWQVSDPLRWTEIAAARRLDAGFLAARRWLPLATETNGIANLARVADSRQGDTVLARVSVPSADARRFRFGFTDVARVYVDGRLVFEGSDAYRSRDYRFLGTVGLHDCIFTDSNADTTELLLAVREGLGGWAVTGALPESVTVPITVETVDGPRAKAIHAELSELSRDGFGGAVIAAEGGTLILEAGYGLADRQQGLPFTSKTTAQIGSLTKQFTAIAIIDLALAGKIQFDAAVGTYLPDAAAPASRATIHQLLTHTSGMPEHFGDDFDRVSRRDLLQRCMAQPLRFPPGEGSAYSNPAYSVLAAVVETVSGRDLEEYLRTQILAPNGLLDTGYTPSADAVLAHGYLQGADKGVVSDRLAELDGDYWALKGNGGMQMTAVDMLRWYEALAGRRQLSRAHIEAALTPRSKDTGKSWRAYGWSVGVGDDGVVERISHAGSDGVFFSYFWWDPRSDRFFYLVGNNGEELVTDAVRRTLRAMSH